MKILYVATSFPEPSKGATIYTDLAEELHKREHDITVVVADEKRNINETLIKKERGISVLRVLVGDFYDVGFVKKGITQLTMPQKIKKAIDDNLSSHSYDLILFESPPVTNASLIDKLMKKFKCSSYLMLKDIFPQNAVDLKLFKKSTPIYYYYRYLEKKLYSVASYIGTMSEANKQFILKENPWINKDKIEIFPNTKKINEFDLGKQSGIRESLNIPLESKVFLFGGNMGKPQYLNGLANVISKLRDKEDIYFLFVGRGTDKHILTEAINNNKIKNAQVLDNLPRDEYEELIKNTDVGIISLHPDFNIPNFPSRILSYMEYKKPVLALTDKNTDFKEMIEESGCGRWVYSQDIDKIIENINKLVYEDDLISMGDNGRKYLEKNYDVKYSVDILESHFS